MARLLEGKTAAADGAGGGSTRPAGAADESFMHHLAAEVGPHGVRVCGLWTAGVGETPSSERLAGVGGPNVPGTDTVKHAIAAGTAALLASIRAGGINGAMVNVTCGLVPR